jgi:hypothetical protein
VGNLEELYSISRPITHLLTHSLTHQDVANYMRNDEKRAYGTVIAGGEAAEAKVDRAFLSSLLIQWL